MTQQADPRLPLVDPAVDAGTTAPGTGTPMVPPAGWPPTAPGAHLAPPSPAAGFGPIAGFRTTATTVTLSPEVRAKVDADLVPAIDRTLADLDTLSTSRNQGRLSDAADRLQTDSQAMVTAATAAIGG